MTHRTELVAFKVLSRPIGGRSSVIYRIGGRFFNPTTQIVATVVGVPIVDRKEIRQGVVIHIAKIVGDVEKEALS